MIQRIQSLWLLLAAVLAFLSLKLPFYYGDKNETVKSVPLTGTESMGLLAVIIAVLTIALITIFLYKNRKMQLRLCLVGILLQSIVLYLFYLEMRDFVRGTFSISCLLPLLVVVFYFLAAKGIRNDERIIRESNKFR